MRDFGIVAGVTGLFFLFGAAFGALAVIAASALRGGAERGKRKRARSMHDDTDYGAGWPAGGWPASGWPGALADTAEPGWEEPPGPDTGGEDNSPPRWPTGPSRR